MHAPEKALYYAAALLSAASWALGGVLWRILAEKIPAASLNLCRALVGSGYLALVLALTGFQPVGLRPGLLLAASGLIGISLGDTLFFRALLLLGPRLTSLLGTLHPISIAVFSVLLLGERPGAAVWAGVAATAAGVAWVVAERAPREGGLVRDKAAGVRCALLGMASTTAAVLLAKAALGAVPAAEAALIRLASGAAGLVALGLPGGHVRAWLSPLGRPRVAGKLAGVVVVTVFGGFWLSLVALKHVEASVAGVLTSTTPLFVLPLSALLLGERVTPRALLGTLVAIGGVGLVCLG